MFGERRGSAHMSNKIAGLFGVICLASEELGDAVKRVVIPGFIGSIVCQYVDFKSWTAVAAPKLWPDQIMEPGRWTSSWFTNIFTTSVVSFFFLSELFGSRFVGAWP